MSRTNSQRLGALNGLLTRDRLRVYPTALLGMFTLIWVIHVVAAPSTLLPDFRARWTAGAMVIDGRHADLYNPVAQSVIQRSEGAHSLSWFVSPPHVAVLFTPFGAVPYEVAALLWLVTSVTGLALVVRLLRPYWPEQWGPYWLVALIAVASQPTLELLGDGQDSWLILLSGVLAWRLWRAQRPWWAGAALSIGLLTKPQLALAAIVLVLLYGGIRMVGGLIVGSLSCVLPTLLVLGPAVWSDWLRTISSPMFTDQVTIGQSYKAASLQGFAIALAPAGAMRAAAHVGLAAGLLLLVVWAVWLVRKSPPQWMVLSTAAFVTVLAAPHAMVYDLVVVLPGVATFVCREARPVIRVASAAGFVVVWLAPLLSFARSAVWPVSVLSAQWVVLVPLTLTLLAISSRMEQLGPPLPKRGAQRGGEQTSVGRGPLSVPE